MLLEAGADPKIKDSNKKTALDLAVAKGEIFLQIEMDKKLKFKLYFNFRKLENRRIIN